MTDSRFWGGYLLGIVTVLALNLFASDSFSLRGGSVPCLVAALAGLGLLLARFALAATCDPTAAEMDFTTAR